MIKTTKKTTSNTAFIKVSKGVYKVGNRYAVRKMIGGVRNYVSFPSVAKAKAYYKSFSK